MKTLSMRRLSLIFVLASLGWALALGLNVLPMMRGDYGWRWPYAFPPEHTERLLPLALLLALYMAGAWALLRLGRAALVMTWAVIGTIALTVSILYVGWDRPRYELYTRTVSNLTTGWHYAAAEIDEEGGSLPVLRDWPEFMHRYVGVASHVTVSPPGLPILYYTAGSALDQTGRLAQSLAAPLRADQCHDYRIANYTNGELASAWLGILMPLWAALTVIPLYKLGQRFYSQRVGMLGALWWPLIPSLLMFAPHPSTIYPLFAVTSIALLAAGFDSKPWWVALSGLVIGLLTFINLTSLPLVFMAGALTLLFYWLKRDDLSLRWHWPILTGLWFALGLGLVWLIYALISGVTPWAILGAVMQEHLSLDRPYLPWVFLHLNDFGMFTGWPLILLAIVAVARAVRVIRQRSTDTMGAAITVAAALTILAIDLSGVNRGESGRIWLFLVPFLLLGAADVLARASDARAPWIITSGQAAMVLVMVAFVHVIDSGLSDPPAPPSAPAEAAMTPGYPSGAVFGGTLKLDSFAGQIERGSSGDPVLVLWLNWQSHGQVDRTYYLGIIPVAPDGQPIESALVQPFQEAYPTTCWLPSSGLLQDRIEVLLPTDSTEGDWWVSLSLVDGQNGDKLSVITADGLEDTQVGIGPFRPIGD